jgi:excinuclease ABC subunit C
VLIGQSRQEGFVPGDGVAELRAALGIGRDPERIEAFDISNMHEKNSVGSMVVFYKGLPSKDEYRRFRIKTVRGIDDYKMIKEVVTRRYARLIAEKRHLPDLILIDGGPGQLSAAKEAVDAFKLTVPMISVAKKFEHVFIAGRNDPVILPARSKALKLIQRVRDEAHRFAVAYHKLLRQKSFFGKDL